MRGTERMMRMLLCCGVFALAGCSISRPASVAALGRVMGDSLPGTQGATVEDQINIDRTVARGCGAGIYEGRKCAAHTIASRDRLKELRG